MRLIRLTKGKFAMVDDSDYEFIKKIGWHLSGRYARASSGERISMHRLIMGLKNGDEGLVDHKDGDGLCNLRANLRITNRSQNQWNKAGFSKSGYKGVRRVLNNKKDLRWGASIYPNNKQVFIGLFPYTDEGKIEAAKKYDEYAKKYFGIYAKLNFPDTSLRCYTDDEYMEALRFYENEQREEKKKKSLLRKQCLIPLTHGKFSKVSPEDYDFVNQYKWGYDRGYACRVKYLGGGRKNRKCENIQMHRVVLGLKNYKIDKRFVDHIDHDKLNNTRENLRIATRRQNNCNIRNHKNSLSKYLGVSRHVLRKGKYEYVRWEARLSKNGKSHYLGRFPYTKEGEILAAKAYNDAAKKHHGAFANLNIF